MPNYYNPYNFYPASYQPAVGQASFAPYLNPQLSTPPVSTQTQPQQQVKTMEWVDGEVGAKAFQMPSWLPANVSIPLWDSTEPYIYFKSWNQMGMPNPLQKIKYDPTPVQNEPQKMLPQGQSGAANAGTSNNQNGISTEETLKVDTANFVTKDEFLQMKEELKEIIQKQAQAQNCINQIPTENSNRNAGNRGGNR